MLQSFFSSTVMGSLVGFRLPQFSEEEAWLPSWLQQHNNKNVEESLNDEHRREEEEEEPQTPALQQSCQELAFLHRNSSTGEDAHISPRSEGGYKSLHLFLSGEDNSPLSFTQSSGMVVRFHLHLSLDGNSQNTPGSLLNTSPGLCDTLPMQPLETSVVLEEKNRFEGNHNGGVVNFPLSTPQQEKSRNSGHRSVTYNEDKVKNHKENTKSPSKVADINDAVELSIAASEALVIHELTETESFSKSLPASAVLEVALQVKQARLEGLEETSCYSTEEISEIPFLSDLDESSMADAYEDVGLSVTDPDDMHGCDLTASQVKVTFASEIYISDEKSIYEEVRIPELGCGEISRKEPPKDVLDIDRQLTNDLALESFDGEMQKKLVNDTALSLDTTSVPCHVDLMLHCAAMENPFISAQVEKLDFFMGDEASFRATINSSLWTRISETTDTENRATNKVPDRFRSRWLGGWTGKKESNDSAPVEPNTSKSIPELFVRESSSLSESADIAPDENSFVQKQDKGSNIASQSSIPFEGLCNKDNQWILPSDDVASSFSLSFDPLCSVVPCSISSEHACSTPALNEKDKVDPGNCFIPTPHDIDNLCRTSALNLELVQEEIPAGPVKTGPVRRQFASLKTYSMMLPSHGTLLGTGIINCKKSSPLKCNERLLSTVTKTPVTDLTQETRNREETAKDGTEFTDPRHKERSSPIILNRGRRRRFQASLHHNIDEGTPELAVVPESDVELLQQKNAQKAGPKCKNPHDTRVPARKHVHFLETEINLPQKRKLQKLQSAYRYCSTSRSDKRLKCSNLLFESGACEEKPCVKNYPAKDGKKTIFQNMEFLLTGFSFQKEREIKRLIKKYGGIIVSNIPSPPNSRAKRRLRFKCQPLPIVLCLNKLQTTKFLYGCAVNACILKVNWLTDSIAANSVLTPEKYIILPDHVGGKTMRIGKPAPRNNYHYVFNNVGIMLHGAHDFCNKMASIVKHGGGQVFKTLQPLVQSLDAETISMGAIVAEDTSMASRHLKHCALEQKIHMMPVSWMIKSLHVGKLLPMENIHSSHFPPNKLLDFPVSMEWSEEI